MPYSPRTHKSATHKLWSPQTITTTQSSTYWKPLKAKVYIYNNKGDVLWYLYDSFNPNNPTDNMGQLNNHHAMFSLRVTRGKNKNTIEYSILDENRTWSRRVASEGNYVRVLAGKTTSSLQFLFAGYIKKMRPRHIGNAKREMHFVGQGEKAETNNIIVTFQRAATSFTLNDADSDIPRRPDSQMAVNVLVKELLESNGIRVSSTQPIKDALGLDLSGISPDVNAKVLSVSFINIELNIILDFFAEITGAIWDIVDGKFVFEFPKLKHSGITIRSRTNQSSTDLADSTGYFTGDSWEYEESIDKGDGFMTHPSTKTIISSKSVANISHSGGGQFYVSSLYKRWLAVQFSAIDGRFITVKLVLSRIGDPTGGINDAEHPVLLKGKIVTDNNDTPTGSTVVEFDVPYGSLTSEPTDVFINGLKVDPANASPNTKYWIILSAIGMTRSDAVRWHHDNNVSVEGRRSAWATGDFEDEDNLSWRVSQRGPMYLFTVFSKVQRIQFYGNQEAADRYNQTDSVLDVSYLEDVESVATLMQMELAVRSNPARIYDANKVTIPSNKLYLPGEMVTIVDPTLGLDENENVEAQIEEVDYAFETSDLGCRFVTLRPLGEYKFKIEDIPSS